MRIQEVIKALADPTRRAILEALREEDLTPTQLLERVSVSQPTLSHHLRILHEAGLVRARKEGRFVRYSLDMSALDLLVAYLMALRKTREEES